MERLILERRHSTGIVAQVFGETEGAGYRPGTSPDVSAPPGDWPYLDTIDEAQSAADADAHPGCLGDGCGPWTPHVSALPPE
ncbi:MAG: hypothetical protein AB7H88_01125 [Vicinamibacterales bacterium]